MSHEPKKFGIFSRQENPNWPIGYESASSIELLGLGANAWRSPAGYIGLTMLFWSPVDQAFFSCTDARPDNQRAFNPVARYRAPGPWSGLGAPQQATGRHVQLTAAQINSAGRLSAAEATSATVAPATGSRKFASLLRPCGSWSEIVEARAAARRSLLAEPEPMKDWVVLQPSRFGTAHFDNARQTLVWPLFDGDGKQLDLELRYDEFNAPAIARIEGLRSDELRDGTLIVARIRSAATGLIGEPLSLVRPESAGGDQPVDALYFDAAKERGPISKLFSKLRSGEGGNVPAGADSRPLFPQVLLEARHSLRRQAERGCAVDQENQVKEQAKIWAGKASDIGFTGFRSLLNASTSATDFLLRANYFWLQHERLLTNAADEDTQ